MMDIQSTADSSFPGIRFGYRENADLCSTLYYNTGLAQLFIDNNYTGSTTSTEYSTIYFRNKNASNALKKRMRIGGHNGYISIHSKGDDVGEATQAFEVQGGTNGNIFMGNNLVGYTVGQYPVFGTTGNDLHFQAGNTYTGYISYNGGFTDAESWMADVARKTGNTGIYYGEGHQVTYEDLIELLDKDETAIRDINIGYQNSIVVRADIAGNQWEKLYWTPRKKPAGIGGKNPSDVIFERSLINPRSKHEPRNVL